MASSRTIGSRARPEPLWKSRQSFFTEVALFNLGVAGVYSINLIGALPGSEVILLPMLPILLLAKGSRAFQRQYLMFYILAGLWFIGTQIADQLQRNLGFSSAERNRKGRLFHSRLHRTCHLYK